jgi:type I restriction enzyme S subunit
MQKLQSEDHHSIPSKWHINSLQQISEGKDAIRIGPFGSSLKKHELMNEGYILTLWIENIVNNELNLEYKKYITEEKYQQLRGFTVKPDDVLITMMGTVGRIAVVPKDIGKAIISSHLLKITLDKTECLPRYLYYYLLSHSTRRQFSKEARGIVMEGLNSKIIRGLQIRLPPISEQYKIIQILSNIDELIQKTDQIIEQTQRLKKGLMQKLLTKGIGHTEFKRTGLGIMPKTWTLAALNSVCDKIQDGSHFSPKIQYSTPGENRFLYITAKNVKENGIDLSDVAYVDKQFHVTIYSRCNPEKGDVLLVKDGVMTGVAIVNNLDEPFSMLSSVALIKTSRSVLDPHYLKYYLGSPLGFGMITNQMTGTAIKRIILDKIRASSIPLPPILEQKKIGHFLNSMDKKISILMNYKITVGRLRRGLMQDLLTGKSRVKL